MSSKPYWKCEKCGHEFRDEDMLVKEAYDHNPYEASYLCPNCKSDWLIQGKECIYCGKWFDYEDEYFEDCCHECGQDAVDAMKAYIKESKPMTETQRTIFWDYWGCL